MRAIARIIARDLRALARVLVATVARRAHLSLSALHGRTFAPAARGGQSG